MTHVARQAPVREVKALGNYVKTAVLLAGLTALFGAVGFAYWNSDRLALSAHNAVEVDGRTAPDLVRPRRVSWG
jgi:hypothetical protein